MAIKVSNIVEFEQKRLNAGRSLIGVIATVRAATFLDVYEMHQDFELVKFARKTINKAWAISKSNEASLVYKRIEKFERARERAEFKVKVNEAYKEWGSWVK